MYSCNCVNSVCPLCLDLTMENVVQGIRNKTVGRDTVNALITMKELLITMLTNPEIKRQLQLEVEALKKMRDFQFHYMP